MCPIMPRSICRCGWCSRIGGARKIPEFFIPGCGAAQILWRDVPDHAAVDLSVRLVQSDRRAAKYAGLVNAVLRRCAREGQPLIDEVKSETLDLPPWLLARWTTHYGEAVARDIAVAIGHEPSPDITVQSDAAQW